VALGLAAALGAALLYGVAAVLQAAGARRVERADTIDPRLLTRIARQPTAMVALGLLAVGYTLHLTSVRLLPLFLAQAGIAFSLVVTALFAVVRFGERLGRQEWAAIGAVIVGLCVLAASSGDVGKGGGGSLAWILLASVAVIALLAAAATRLRSATGTALLGLLAGCGYAVVGIASRLLPDFSPADLARSPATYALVGGGVLAFLVYSVALQRGVVTLATTPMIVTQTVTPSVVGVVLLGDGVRPGWSWTAAAGFVLTIAAATTLVRFEGGHGVGEQGADDRGSTAAPGEREAGPPEKAVEQTIEKTVEPDVAAGPEPRR